MSNTRINPRSEAKIYMVAFPLYIKGENIIDNPTILIAAMNLFLYHLPDLSFASILYVGDDRAHLLFPSYHVALQSS